MSSRYDSWRDQFAAERDRIRAAAVARGFEDEIDRIEHVGSTAVPELAAKDIVDLDIVVDDESMAAVSRALEAELGGNRIENSDGWHPLFREEGGQRFNDHVFAVSDDGWKVSVVTREVLRVRPGLRGECERLKQELTGEHDDLEAYSMGKTAFIARVLETARRDDDVSIEFAIPERD